MSIEGHFVFGGQPGAPASESQTITDNDGNLAAIIDEALGDSEPGPDEQREDRSELKREIMTAAPDILGALDIHLGLQASDPRISFIVKTAVDAGVDNRQEFAVWLQHLTGALRASGYRPSGVDTVVAYLKQAIAAKASRGT